MKLAIIGTLLCLSMAIVWFYFFSPKRKADIEQPKYDMLNEGDKK
jgi:cbb3-type cytochrome oxidase subunit 3